jgi:predicted Zn-dependent peptidase
LSNGRVGLIDTDLNNKMKTLGASSGAMKMKDYGLFILSGSPNEGQTLDEVKDLLLQELDKLKNGDWDEGMLKSIMANAKLARLNSLDNNQSRVSKMVDCFIDDIPWEQNVTQLDRLSKLTKADITKWAKENLKGYVTLYKRKGEDTTIVKIEKPAITPIPSNRDMRSKFMTDFMTMKVEDIQPQFIDFNKELTFSTTKNGLPMIYKQNTTDERFSLTYRFEFGDLADQRYDIAAGYMDLLGTDKETLEDIQRDFYDIACSYNVSVGDDVTSISVSGLQENMPKAITMMENLLQNLKSDTAVYNKLLDQTAKSRMERRNKQSNCYGALVSYGLYGEKNPTNNMPSVSEMRQMDPAVFTELLKGLTSMKHEVIYWGPASLSKLKDIIAKCPSAKIKDFKDVPVNKYYTKLMTPTNEVYLAHYDAPNINMRMIHNEGKKLDIDKLPLISLFNEYFGGGMNAIVFQELRETRGLAYNAWATYNTPGRKNDTEY